MAQLETAYQLSAEQRFGLGVSGPAGLAAA